jgi:hypothetical protein
MSLCVRSFRRLGGGLPSIAASCRPAHNHRRWLAPDPRLAAASAADLVFSPGHASGGGCSAPSGSGGLPPAPTVAVIPPAVFLSAVYLALAVFPPGCSRLVVLGFWFVVVWIRNMIMLVTFYRFSGGRGVGLTMAGSAVTQELEAGCRQRVAVVSP